jgi:hypothetical protein
MIDKTPKPWRMHEDEYLTAAFRGGSNTKQIARDLKRCVDGVRKRIVILGLRGERGIDVQSRDRTLSLYEWSQQGHQCPAAASRAMENHYKAVAAKRGWRVHDYARAA